MQGSIRTLARAGVVLLALSPPLLGAATGDPCLDIFSSTFEAGETLAGEQDGLCQAGTLNDTGIQFCGEAQTENDAACGGTTPLGQDADYGRDALAAAGTLTKFGSGEAGFDFSKVSNAGALLPVDALLGTAPDEWACTRDNVTGLVWEAKIVDTNSPRGYLKNYTWYDPDSADGHVGDEGTTAYCGNTLGGANCNTLNYAAAVNASGLCGGSNWRLPTVKELEQLVHFERSSPAIDPGFFPNMTDWWYWSGSLKADVIAGGSWNVHLQQGVTTFGDRSNTMRVILVRRAE